MSNKKYYWLKLNDNFFDEDTIVWLEEQENGKDYVNFYLKLLLKSLREEGKLVRYIGERVMPYDTKSLSKLTNTPVDTVAVAMKVFIDIGLVQELDSGELYLTQLKEMIGSETRQASIMRRKRALEKSVECEEVTLLPDVTKCYTEIDIELEREKELEKDNTLEQSEELFNKFWKLYPKKTNKQNAKRSFNRIVTNQDLLDTIIDDLQKRVKTENWKKNNGQFIPHASTYLNGKRWEDELGDIKKERELSGVGTYIG